VAAPALAPPAAAPAPSAPVTPPARPIVAPRGATLATEIDTLLDNPALQRSTWAVVVQSLDSGEFLYRRNATKLLMPASNMKIVTLATAAERLGWDFTFETRLVTTGSIDRGVLHGDLLVVGSGDPTFNRRHADPAQTFDAWATELRAAGIKAIDGRIVGDDRFFQRELLGGGWAWDNLVYAYSAPVSALELNENTVDLVIRPGRAVGALASVQVRPAQSGMVADSQVLTGTKDSPTVVEVRRLPGSAVVHVSGTVPLGGSDTTRTVAVDNPAEYFARIVRASLIAGGISVRGGAADVSALPAPPDVSAARVLVSCKSVPLSDIARVLMKTSQNLYAETLLRRLGAPADEPGSSTSVDAGRKAERETLESWGIAPDSFVVMDGSGLSRYNYLAAETIAAVLRKMYDDPRHRAPFIAALAVAGVDGTLASRFKGTRVAGNAHAKTGSIANGRALSGYVQTLDGETFVFSIIANNFNLPASTVDATTDLVVERLATFTRK
jgi:D-alanyl-D-alanine carboxypeptidase/D-alanyl-D-alanine-endopeptidase (penicillin-binding protein 4)